MFGLVPKPIWSKRIAADDQNRIPQHAHVLLVELADGSLGLIDAGCGDAERFSARERELSGLGPGWPLMEALRGHGIDPGAISFLVFTHLHWDHAGGALSAPGSASPLTFPHATHILHALEWRDATSGNPLLYKSYPPAIPAALASAQREEIDGDDVEVRPGIRLARTSGHTRGHCCVILENAEIRLPDLPPEFRGPRRLLLAGDVCPSRHNLRMVFQTSYDTFPLDTRSWKLEWLPRIARDGTALMFDHDPGAYGALIREDPREEFSVTALLPAPER